MKEGEGERAHEVRFLGLILPGIKGLVLARPSAVSFRTFSTAHLNRAGLFCLLKLSMNYLPSCCKLLKTGQRNNKKWIVSISTKTQTEAGGFP